jgi:hypothetical protein
VVLGGVVVMFGSLLVVLRCLLVRFGGFLRHERLPFEKRPGRYGQVRVADAERETPAKTRPQRGSLLVFES